MALSTKDSFSDLDRHRERLEENIAKLRTAIRHWQTWEAEYEGLKAEVSALGENASSKDISEVGKEFGGSVIDQKEIDSLLGSDPLNRRSSCQVIDVLARRIEYVHRNVETVEKQLRSAEDKLASVFVIKDPDINNEEGLPVLEIREELDDRGNVISSSTSTAKAEAPKLLEMLNRAGVKDSTGSTSSLVSRSDQDISSGASGPEVNRVTEIEDPSKDIMSPVPDRPAPRNQPSPSKVKREAKSVSNEPAKSSELPNPRFLKVLQSEDAFLGNKTSLSPTKQAQKNQGVQNSSAPIIPTDDSPEEGALRREMLDYSYSEVGNIVAEMNLDDDDSEMSYSEEEGSETDQSEQSGGSTEDKFGRTTRKVVTDDYRREMEELEKKLNARMMHNAGPASDADDSELSMLPEAKEQVVEKTEPSPADTASKRRPSKKGVRFADELDVSPSATREDSSASKIAKERPREVAPSPPAPPMRDSIVERAAPSSQHQSPSEQQQQQQQPPQKPSRFKAMRSGSGSNSTTPDLPPIPHPQPQPHQESQSPPPSDPDPNPLSSTIIERPQPTSQTSAPPTKPTPTPTIQGEDPTNHDREIRTEYYSRRNHLIQTQRGGFVAADLSDAEARLEDSEGRVSLDHGGDGRRGGGGEHEEGGGGGGKKMSLFRRARVGL